MKITYDWPIDPEYGPAPGPGDVLESLRRRDLKPTGTRYIILGARKVAMREPRMDPYGRSIERWVYDVVHVEVLAQVKGRRMVRVETIVWHPR